MTTFVAIAATPLLLARIGRRAPNHAKVFVNPVLGHEKSGFEQRLAHSGCASMRVLPPFVEHTRLLKRASP